MRTETDRHRSGHRQGDQQTKRLDRFRGASLSVHVHRSLVRFPGVMNQNMPYFGLHSPTKLVALARSRMHVNLIDIETGTIEAYFKAGEDRFLNSLLVSGNGRYIFPWAFTSRMCRTEVQQSLPPPSSCTSLRHSYRYPVSSVFVFVSVGKFQNWSCSNRIFFFPRATLLNE